MATAVPYSSAKDLLQTHVQVLLSSPQIFGNSKVFAHAK